MQLRKPGTRRSIFKVHSYGLENVATELFPSLSFCEDRVSKRTGAVATLFRIADFKD